MSGWGSAIAAVASILLALGAPTTASAAGSGSFTPVGGVLPQWLQSGATAASLPGNRVLVAGGFTSAGRYGGTASAEIEILNSQGAIVERTVMSHSRSSAAAASLPDGRVLIVGGFEGGSGFFGPGTVIASSEIYDPRTNTLSPGPSLGTPRQSAVAVSLRDGRVLVIGGWNGGPLASVEVLNPGAAAFTPAGSLKAPRGGAAGGLVPDGRVLVMGGSTEQYRYRADTEFYDPATGTSTDGPPPLFYPFLTPGAVAAPLPDGRILVIGGSESSAKGADVYDPRLGRFSTQGIGQLHHGRAHAAVAPLSDGRVLVVGGNGPGVNQSAEIFAATNAFKAKLVGQRLMVKVRASGSVIVRGSGHPARPSVNLAATSKGLRIKRSRRSGGPGKIRVPLRLPKRGKRLLRHGLLAMKLRVTFRPVGGLPRTKVKRLHPSD